MVQKTTVCYQDDSFRYKTTQTNKQTKTPSSKKIKKIQAESNGFWNCYLVMDLELAEIRKDFLKLEKIGTINHEPLQVTTAKKKKKKNVYEECSTMYNIRKI